MLIMNELFIYSCANKLLIYLLKNCVVTNKFIYMNFYL